MPYPFEDENDWLRRLPGYEYLYGTGYNSPSYNYGDDQGDIGPGLSRAGQDQGIGYYASKLGAGLLHGLGSAVSTAMYPLSLPKRGIDWLAREGARLQGLNVSDDATAEQMLGNVVVSGKPENTAEALVKGATEVAGGFALDPVMWTGLPFGSATKGQNLAAKILAEQQGLQVYAPKVAEALGSAVERPISKFAARMAERYAPGASAEELARLGEKIQKPLSAAATAAHYGMTGQMAAGGISSLAQAAGQAVAQGWTPESTYETVHGLGELGMAGLGQYGHITGEQGRAKAVASQQRFEPTRVIPTDTLPDNVRQEAEAYAKKWSDDRLAGLEPSIDELPDHLKPHGNVILQQANEDFGALNDGKSFIERLRQEHEPGQEGVSVEDAKDGGKHVVMRGKDGQIIGGAAVNELGELKFLAGPRAIGLKESAQPIYTELDRIGAEKPQSYDIEGKPELLSPGGALARRRVAEKQYPAEYLEGRKTMEDLAKEAQGAQQDLDQAGLGDLSPAFAVKPGAKEIGNTGLYSRLQELVDDPRTQAKQTGDQWTKFLSDPNRGVKADEMKWTGLDDFLQERKGKPVTKQEIQQHLAENEVKVEEVTKGGEDPGLVARYRDLSRREENGVPLSTADRAELQHLIFQREGKPTKFSQYTEPGGSNYRELLLTLPNEIRPDHKAALGEMNALQRESSDKMEAWKRLSEEQPGSAEAVQAYEAYRNARKRADVAINNSVELDKQRRARNFTAGHFDESNVLAHIRFNDRTDAEGKKVLFLEELQSDWAQKGRREGFRDDPKRIADLQNQYRQVTDALLATKDPQEQIRLSGDLANIEAAIHESKSLGHPQAPFVTDTSKWTELALKRILKYAADNGYDKVAWTTGEQQAKRYDLSKQVSRIDYIHEKPGFSKPVLRAYDHEGNRVIDQFIAKPEDLADYIGKEAADRLLKTEPVFDSADEMEKHILEGEDLEVGGEGMKGFYDQIVPQIAGKLGKKFGARVGKTEIPTNVVNRESAAQGLEEPVVAGGHQVVHSLDLPDSMRETVKREGFPLFAVDKGDKQKVKTNVLDLLTKLYPDGSHIKEGGGTYTVTLPNKRTVTWKPGKDFIEINVPAFEKGYQRKPTPQELAAGGAGVTDRLPNKAVVDLVEGADPKIVLHEHWHVLKHLGVLSDRDRESLSKRFKNEEEEADAFADWWQKEQRPADTIWRKIGRGISNVYEAITGRPESTFRRLQKKAFEVQEKTKERKATDFVAPDVQRVNLNRHLKNINTPPKDENKLRLTTPEGKPFMTGALSNEEWLQKALAWTGPEGSKELADARSWYRNLLGEFQKRYGKDAEDKLKLWALTQQRASPSAGFANLLRAEDVHAGFRGPEEPKAGLAHDRLLAMLAGDKVPLGQKLADFVDAVHGSRTRQWVAHDERGGAPAPVDVHAARDVGFVDEISINRVREMFGDEVAKKLKQDVDAAAPDPNQYRYGSDRYNELARWLNEQKVDGGGWTADEAQAVGWVAQIRMMGGKAEGPRSIFPPSMADVAVEVAPGKGSPRAELWDKIPENRRAQVTKRVVNDVAPHAAKVAGVRLLGKQATVGGWEQYTNPNVTFQVLGPDGARRFAAVMARALHQTEVWAQRNAPRSRANSIGVDIFGNKNYDLSRPEEVQRFWSENLADVPGLGFTHVKVGDRPAVRVIVDNMREAKKVTDALSSDFEAETRPLDVVKSVNDWEVNRAGEGHTQGIRGLGGAALDAVLGRAQESFERHAADAAGDEVRARAATAGAEELAGVADSPEQRGPPREAYAVAPGVVPPTPPSPAPGAGGYQRATGNPPRVETRYENLDEAIAEQNKLGIPAGNVAHEQRRTWASIDPEVQKEIKTFDKDKYLKMVAQNRHLDDVQVQALDAVTRGHREAKDLARVDYMAAKGGPDEAKTWRKYVETLADYTALETANIRDGRGTARALAARARIMQAAQTGDRQFLRAVLREIPGIDESAAQQLQAMFETGDPRLADALRASFTGKWKQWQTILRAFLITPSSEIANGLGNGLGVGVEIADRAAASGVDWLVSALRGTNRERHLGAIGAGLGSMIEEVPNAMRSFLKERFVQIYKRAWTGLDERQIDPSRNLEYQVGAPFAETGVLARLGRLTATSLDAMQAGDEFFQAPIAKQEIGQRAYELARAKNPGASATQLRADTLNIIADAVHFPEKYPKLISDVRSAVQRRLFKDKPWTPVSVLQNMSERYPWMSAVLPFIKTPANIARYAIHHSPLGMLSPDFIEATKRLATGKGEMSQGEASDIVARRITGTALFAMAMGAAKLGKITNGGPGDPDEKKALMETGWRPYSIVVDTPAGKAYIPFARFDPISQVVGVASDVAGLADARDAHDAATRAVGSIAENLTDRTYLKGLIDFSEALSDPLRFAGNYAIGIGEMHIPRQVARIAQALDPVVRDVKPTTGGVGGFLQQALNSLKRDIPGVSQTMTPKYSVTGEPMIRPGEGVMGGLMRAVSPVQASPERENRNLEALMAKIGYVPAAARTFMTIKGAQIVLDQRQVDLVHKADAAAAQELRMLVTNPMFGVLPDTIEEGGDRSKEAIMRKVYNKHRDLARQAIMRQPEFITSARQQLAALRPGGVV